MNLAANVCSDEADDALDLGAADPFAAVLTADAGAIDPQTAVRVDHDLDHGRIAQGGGNGGTERRAQHLPPTALCFLACVHR